ncbi:sel1 repeat family protein [Caldichromatium japonicum]|uniref:Sel1 repeat family protein n=1 Tax=Caldichromatium japonicum TaxID=2699430 RepID=A0A6G7VCE4_9GAMM|nr:tetratricopeptide repeat protein [Caldichromatium japonicum]QIK37753.1 sel1 repeat family protein [Caldichromatium japonicum]
MSNNPTAFDIDLASGIAAFESKQFTRAAQLLSPLAEQGNAEAQYRMAIMAQNGLGMHPNPLMAYSYMKKAAEAGLGLAQHGLAFMYMTGECAEQNPAKAIEWFKKAADQGMVGSLTTLAMMYEQGYGVPQDFEEARRLYRLAGFDDC